MRLRYALKARPAIVVLAGATILALLACDIPPTAVRAPTTSTAPRATAAATQTEATTPEETPDGTGGSRNPLGSAHADRAHDGGDT